MTQSFIINNCDGVHLRQPVEGGIGEQNAIQPQFLMPVRIMQTSIYLPMARRLCSLSSICGFRFHKQQVHQATGGIVNIDQSSTGSTPAFKPVVVAAINLYQLASTRPPVTRLMNFRRALSARDPDSGFYHEASDSFLAKNQTVNFLQIFQRQRGAKITVVLPDYTECLIYQ